MRHLLSLPLAVLSIASYCLLAGCHGSEEAMNALSLQLGTATKQVDSLRAANDSLNARLYRLVQENLRAGAHAAELETQLADLKQKPAVAQPASTTAANPEEAYQQALDAYRLHEYGEAFNGFQAALAGGIAEGLQDNCMYWMGECLYGEKKYGEAIGQFRKVFDFPISEKKDDAQMMIGNCYLALGEKDKAKGEYEKLVRVFPASPYVKKAKEKLARLPG